MFSTIMAPTKKNQEYPKIYFSLKNYQKMVTWHYKFIVQETIEKSSKEKGLFKVLLCPFFL